MLKADRVVSRDDIRFACTSTGEAGMALVFKTAGSGVGVGDTAGSVEVIANPSGKAFAGILMHEVVELDETRFHRNDQKIQHLKNERCQMLKEGRVTTDNISGSISSVPTNAYVTANGEFTATVDTNGGVAATPLAGQFESLKNENGFATIVINLP